MTKYNYKYFGTFRFLLAVIVVISHLQSDFSPSWLNRILTPLGIGNIGVMMFFVVSGYVISEACIVFYSERIKVFYLNRALRILPPFYFALILSIFVHQFTFLVNLPLLGYDQPYSMLSIKTLPLNVFSVFDYRIPGGFESYYLFVRYVWAIVIEVQFYFAIGLFFILTKKIKVSGKYLFFLVYFSIIVGIYILSIFIKFPVFLKVIEFSPFFLFGVCIYFLNREKYLSRITMFKTYAFISFCLVIISFVLYLKRSPEASVVIPTVAFIALLFVFIFLGRINNVTEQQIIKFKRIDSLLGDLSYPLYLNHFSVEVLLYGLFQIKSILLLVLGVLLSITISWLSYLAVEPFTKRLRDVVRGQVLVK